MPELCADSFAQKEPDCGTREGLYSFLRGGTQKYVGYPGSPITLKTSTRSYWT